MKLVWCNWVDKYVGETMCNLNRLEPGYYPIMKDKIRRSCIHRGSYVYQNEAELKLSQMLDPPIHKHILRNPAGGCVFHSGDRIEIEKAQGV